MAVRGAAIWITQHGAGRTTVEARIHIVPEGPTETRDIARFETMSLDASQDDSQWLKDALVEVIEHL